MLKRCCVQRMIRQVPGDCDLTFGRLLLKGEFYTLLLTHRRIKVQILRQGMGAALPTHGFPAR